ncbi:MAG: phosphatase PAP2 family protein [Chitinophagales bacterium]
MKKKITNRFFCHILLCFVCLFFAENTVLYSQNSTSPYDLSLKREIPLLVGGGIGVGTSLFLKKNKKILNEAEIQALHANDIWAFDRISTKKWSVKSQKASDILMFGAIALPVVLLADKKIRKDVATISLITFETYLINGMFTNLTKEIAQRKRPFLYNPSVPLERKRKADATSSFYSGHTSSVATATFMIAQIYSDYHPNSKAKPYIWATAALIPAVTGYLRVRGGKHYPSDVIIGYIAGASVGIFVPILHRKKE